MAAALHHLLLHYLGWPHSSGNTCCQHLLSSLRADKELILKSACYLTCPQHQLLAEHIVEVLKQFIAAIKFMCTHKHFGKTLCRYFYQIHLSCHLLKWIKSLMRSPKYLICGFFEISCITAESYMKRKKCLNTGTHRRHTLRSGHSIPRAEQKQAQSLSGKPRSTPTGR